MPRMLANEFVYSSTDERYNEYLSPTTSPPANMPPQYHQQPANCLPTALLPGINAIQETTKSRSQSPPQATPNVDEPHTHKQQRDEHHIHTISSSDGEAPQVKDDHNTSLSDIEDFEGFDEEYNTPESSGLMKDQSQEDERQNPSNLKADSQLDYDIYREDSEGVVEAIEVEDDEDVEEVDGQMLFRSNKRSTNVYAECHTPNKRKKQPEESKDVSPSHLKTPPDQIVEINSDSTTISQKQKRQQINTKFQLNLNQMQNHKVNNAGANKCSTESTSEFPVSSPSNPQPRGGGKYPPRPPLLKNTLPADSFERQLAMITACNPQMTLAEKIQGWRFEDEISDVEDVSLFDDKFKLLEEQKKCELTKQKNKKGTGKEKPYDYAIFRQMIVKNMNEASAGGNAGAFQANSAALKGHDESSGSESSANMKHIDERPSTSAIAQQQLQQRRCKPPTNLETGEMKKRPLKDLSKRNQNSTSPPVTSSSENDRDCFQNSKNPTANKRLAAGQIQIHEKLLCPSSSEEANSQDVPTYMHMKTKQQLAQNFNNKRQKFPNKADKTDDKTNSKNLRCSINEETDSVFRLHRLNREIDKPGDKITQIIIDSNENSNSQLSSLKQGPFKTPTVPTKYVGNHISSTEFLAQPTGTAGKLEIHNNNANVTSESHSNLAATTTTIEPQAEIKFENCEADNELHEFCNYLGLTGMSTATAMANAVAELAQYQLKRRSMRVIRQQQQERKEKNAKEERELQASKLKKSKDLRKREKLDCEANLNADEHVSTLEEGSNSQTSEPTQSIASLNEKKKKTSITSMATKSSTKSLTAASPPNKQEPQIKILCHIAANVDKVEDENLEKQTKQSHRPTLMRHVKQRKEQMAKEEEYIDNTAEVKTEYSCGDELKQDQVSSTSPQTTMYDTNKRILRSPRLSPRLTPKPARHAVVVECTEDVAPDQKEEKITKSEITSPLSNNKSVVKSLALTPTKFEVNPSLLASNVSTTKELNNAELKPHSSPDDQLHQLQTDRALTPTSLQIKQKLQAALEESRKSKPSIFIVQSLDSHKETATNLQSPDRTISSLKPLKPNTEIRKHLGNKISKFSAKVANITKRNVTKKLLKVRKAKTHALSSLRSTPKRQLRARKIIVIKTKKTATNKESLKSKEEKELKSQKIFAKQTRSKYSPSPSAKNRDSPKKLEMNSRVNVTKSFRNAETETNDLEIYNIQSKTRLMAKASALLQRSRRVSVSKGAAKNLRSKLTGKLKKSNIKIHGQQPKLQLNKTIETDQRTSCSSNTTSPTSSSKTRAVPFVGSIESQAKSIAVAKECRESLASCHLQDSDHVVVSSTTNTYDERLMPVPPIRHSPGILRSVHSSASYIIASGPIETKDNGTQSEFKSSCGIKYLNGALTTIQTMRNPLNAEHGVVHYIYYEVDILIVVQEHLVSFWKCSRLLNALALACHSRPNQTKANMIPTPPTSQTKSNLMFNHSDALLDMPNTQFGLAPDALINGEWIPLGELKRLTHDFEVFAPYSNRICLHNSTPIYIEMRARSLPKNQRDCNLLSMYINIYYYNDEDMIAKTNSIALDSIQSDVKLVNYTTLVDSRYFIMTWPQENLLGKTRSGLCKYSLTPQLDTLASIREFKSMRHTIRYLECMSDDKLIGFGDSQVSIWDHRSGDVLMNFDLDIPLGRNLGSVYYPSHEMEENNMIIMFQHRDFNKAQEEQPPMLLTVACTITHAQPSYRILQQIQLPTSFKKIERATNTGEHLVITAENSEELWICCNNPSLAALVPPQQTQKNTQRFFNRRRSQLIELGKETLNIDTLANHLLQLAAGLALNTI